MKSLVTFAAKFMLWLASMALLTGLGLFICGAYFMSYPIRGGLSAKSERMQAIMGVGVAIMNVARAYGLDEKAQEMATGASEAPQS